MGRDNNQPHSGKAVTNESQCPFIVELAAPTGELDVELGRLSRDMDAGLLWEVKAIFGGVFPIW